MALAGRESRARRELGTDFDPQSAGSSPLIPMFQILGAAIRDKVLTEMGLWEGSHGASEVVLAPPAASRLNDAC